MSAWRVVEPPEVTDLAWAKCLGDEAKEALCVVRGLRRDFDEDRARVRLLARGQAVHGMVAARRVDLLVDGEPVEAWQIQRLLVDDIGKGRAPLLMRRILAERSLFLGMANDRAVRLWERTAGPRFRSLGRLRLLAFSPRRRWHHASAWSRFEEGAGLHPPDDFPITVDRRAHGATRWGGDGTESSAPRLLIRGEAGLVLAIHELEGKDVLVVLDLAVGGRDLSDAVAQIRHEARRLGASAVLIPVLAGPRADALLEAGARPAADWDPGPTLVINEGTGDIDLGYLGNGGLWELPGWVTL